MRPAELPLEPLQQWMQAVVTHPGDVHDGLASPEAQRHAKQAADVVLPSRTLDPSERVGIYHGMYMLRMIEAMQTDYPALAHFLGEHAFEHLVRDYEQAFPSRSYTFNRFGDHLPEFLASTTMYRRVFLTDLARLELAMTQVFDEAERAPLEANAIGSVAPEDVERLRFTPIPALRLLQTDYDVREAFLAYREGEQIHPKRIKSWLVVHRRDYGVFRMPLTKPAFVFLQSLLNGESIGAAMTTFRRRFQRFPAENEVFTWFRDWSAVGLFASMAVAATEER